MLKFLEEIYKFEFPYKIDSKIVTEKKIISVIKNGTKISEITTLEGLHQETINESLKDFQQKISKLPSSKFSKAIYFYFKQNSVPIKINSAHLWPTDIKTLKSKNQTIKVKVGRSDPRNDKETLETILKHNNTIQFRIDGNACCTSQQMISILENIPRNNIEYIEDAFINKSEEIKFYLESKLTIAMDEKIVGYLRTKNWRDFPSHIKHVVIKPSLLGGLEELRYITKILERKKVSYNLSSTFEGLLGLKFLYSLSKRKEFKLMKTPGIDTFRFLKKKEGP
tara:strand:- start:5000 stop:5842 length:843 start_codon:yes stop_codon:yes gene_type:complete